MFKALRKGKEKKNKEKRKDKHKKKNGIKGARQSNWQTALVDGDLPTARYGHTLVRHPSRNGVFILFGGSNQVEFSNELFILDWNQKKWTMIFEGSDGDGDRDEGKTNPSRRHFHSTVFYSDPKSEDEEMVVFGGKSNGYHNDIWKYNLDQETWTEVKPAQGRSPARRYGHSAIMHGSSMYIFGGYDCDSFTCSDLWSFSFEKGEWSRIDSKTYPPARFLHSAVVCDGTIYVFGGQGEKGPLNDLWAFDIYKKKWTSIQASHPPSPRYGHAAALSPNRSSMIIVGGYNKVASFDDVYQYFFEEKSWVKCNVTGTPPSGAFYHSVAFADDFRLLSFGGRDLQNTYYNEIKTVMIGSAEEGGGLHSDWSDGVPDEVLLHLFSFMNDAVSLCAIARVCKRWNAVAEDPSIWEPVALSVASEHFRWKNVDHIRNYKPEEFKHAVWLVAEKNRKQKDALEKMGDVIHGYQAGFVPVSGKRKVKKSNIMAERTYDASATRPRIKIVISGDGAVGKTCTFCTFVNNTFPAEYVPTVFDNHVFYTNIDGRDVELSLWDTAGPEEYDRLRPLTYPGSDIILMVFSLVSPNSFENVRQKWAPEIRHFCGDIPILLAGTKMDLLEDGAALQSLAESNQAPITIHQAQELAREINAVGFIPYSSLTQQNLKLVIDTLARTVIHSNTAAYTSTADSGRCVLG